MVPSVILIIGDDISVNDFGCYGQIHGQDSECPQKELRAMARQGKLTPAQMDSLIEPRPAEELFNVNDDPHQIENIAGDPEYRNVLEDLRQVMNQ